MTGGRPWRPRPPHARPAHPPPPAARPLPPGRRLGLCVRAAMLHLEAGDPAAADAYVKKAAALAPQAEASGEWVGGWEEGRPGRAANADPLGPTCHALHAEAHRPLPPP